jgi:hypothetical protein
MMILTTERPGEAKKNLFFLFIILSRYDSHLDRRFAMFFFHPLARLVLFHFFNVDSELCAAALTIVLWISLIPETQLKPSIFRLQKAMMSMDDAEVRS